MPITIRQSSTTQTDSKRRTGHTKAKPPLIPLTMPGRYSMGNVMAVSGWSHSKLSKRIRDKQFPPPLKDGTKNYWPTDVVKAALNL